MSNKSQIEMMGFAIIIILVIIGLFLFISFRIMSSPKESISQADQSFIINFVSVFPEIDSTGCGKMSDVIQQCAMNRVTAGCQNPCQELEIAANAILDKTLRRWEIPFDFFIKTRDGTLVDISSPDCNEDTERYAPQVQPIPLSDRGVTIDTIEVTLARCIVR
jgi:hypothetical protein